MKMTPLDIRQKRFEVTFRGYSKREVEAFLEFTAGEFEEVVRENIALKEELKRAQTRLDLPNCVNSSAFVCGWVGVELS